eukprot:NODE_6501_length_281_cov_287.926724_g5889_i0.p1 GENE.NODE_6501_length_281_cov_287.926724_g5889_i0~~NODE_6501_length_281_cov_287.926724_g5889_i0.p1  ORF type:complete len:65 (+),score=18.53 NODE_6501_length_281_cov_287.926724_g5889_i0:27-197(+)
MGAPGFLTSNVLSRITTPLFSAVSSLKKSKSDSFADRDHDSLLYQFQEEHGEFYAA